MGPRVALSAPPVVRTIPHRVATEGYPYSIGALYGCTVPHCYPHWSTALKVRSPEPLSKRFWPCREAKNSLSAERRYKPANPFRRAGEGTRPYEDQVSFQTNVSAAFGGLNEAIALYSISRWLFIFPNRSFPPNSLYFSVPLCYNPNIILNIIFGDSFYEL